MLAEFSETITSLMSSGIRIGIVWWVVYIILIVVLDRILPRKMRSWMMVSILSAIPTLVGILAGLILLFLGYRLIIAAFYGVVFFSPILISIVLILLAILSQQLQDFWL